MNIGLYGGSFNPVHIGHLALANYLCEYAGLDELWFMVSPRNPLKDDADLLPDALRLELVRLSIGDYPRMRLCELEFTLPRPSYTDRTLSALRRAHPEHRFTLIIGADNWRLFSQWRNAARIVATTPILVYPRPGYDLGESPLPPGVRLVDAPTFDISSTHIRQALREGRDVRFMMHPAAWTRLRQVKSEK